MQWLLDQLTKPQIISEGVIRQPTPVMLKAAKVIQELSQLFEIDKAGRTKAEAALAASEAGRIEAESLLRIAGDQLTRAERNLHLKDKEIDKLKYLANDLTPLLAYQETINEDNIRSLT